MSDEMMFTVSRPSIIWSSVANCRASCGTISSPQRTASSIRSDVIDAIPAANTVLSMPSA